MILFRTEATLTIGTGHLMRCLALAENCMKQGKKATFVMQECSVSLVNRLTAAGIEVIMLEDGANVAELLKLIEQLQPTGIVIDGYHFDEQCRLSLSATNLPVLAMDDGSTDYPLHADIVVNTSPLVSEADYKTIAPDARLFLGPEYATLRGEFRHYKKCSQLIPANEQHVLITFGGSDPTNLTLPVVESLLDKFPKQVTLDVVVGGAAVDNNELKQLALKHTGRIHIHNNTSEMASLMGKAKMAISAAGSTRWELAYLTIPTIAVVVADNQAKNLKAPLQNWFDTIDSRDNPQAAIHQITSASLTLWNDDKALENRRTVLSQIKVGAKAMAICKIFDEPLKRPA